VFSAVHLHGGQGRMTIDPKRLIDLTRIADAGSFTAAAQALNISQPALSNSIAALERSLGVRLFERTHRGATLTDYGRVLYGYAQTLETVLARAAEEIEHKRSGFEGGLIVGATPVASAEIVPEAVARLMSEVPNASISIIDGVDDDLIASLIRGELDLIVSPITVRAEFPEIEDEILLPDSFAVVVRPDNARARLKSIRLQDMRDATWVMPNVGSSTRKHIETLFLSAGEPWPSKVVSMTSTLAITSLVMRSNFVAVMSRQLVQTEIRAGLLAAIPLTNPSPFRAVGMRVRRNALHSPMTERLMAILRSVGAELEKGETTAIRR
jgi:DNA-binding transcriptional LysR family regulator